MSDPRPEDSSARGDAEFVIAPDGSVIVFDLDAGLLEAAEALSPGDARLEMMRSVLDRPSRSEPE